MRTYIKILNILYLDVFKFFAEMSVKDGKTTKQGTEENGRWHNEEFSVEVTEGSDDRAVTSETSHRHLLTLTLTDNTQAKKR